MLLKVMLFNHRPMSTTCVIVVYVLRILQIQFLEKTVFFNLTKISLNILLLWFRLKINQCMVQLKPSKQQRIILRMHTCVTTEVSKSQWVNVVIDLTLKIRFMCGLLATELSWRVCQYGVVCTLLSQGEISLHAAHLHMPPSWPGTQKVICTSSNVHED